MEKLVEFILGDSGSDAHLCGPEFAPRCPIHTSTSVQVLRDANQNQIATQGEKTVPMIFGDASTKVVVGRLAVAEALRDEAIASAT